jgi:hypothetical protein
MAAWRFTNVTKSAVFWPTLTGLEFTDSHPRDIATFGARLVDPDNSIEFDLDDELIVEYALNEVDYETVFGGIVTDRTMTDMGRDVPRAWEVSAQDYIVRLDDTLVTGTRSAESARDRVAWIMGITPTQGITATGLPTLSDSLEAHDEYGGVSKREALDEVAQAIDATYYVDFEANLHFFVGEEVYVAPFDLVHPADPPDSYPYWDFQIGDNLDDAATRVYVQGATDHVWRINAAAETALGREIQRQISDDTLTTTAKMNAAGDTFLANTWPPPRKGSLTLLAPGIRSGMTARIAYPEWEDDGVDDTFFITSVSVEFLEPNPDSEES